MTFAGSEPRLRTLCALGVVIAAVRFFSRSAAPDGFDAQGFTLAIGDRFDLAQLQPQFPGYPVFVALGAAVHALGAPAHDAAVAVSAAASGATAVLLGLCAARLSGRSAALSVMALHGVAWLPWFAGSAALSEATGMAFAAAAFAALGRGRPAIAGAAAGLMLGARASYFPLAASVLLLCLRGASPAPRADDARLARPAARPNLARPAARCAAGLLAATAAWLVPFAAWAGPRALLSLGRVHLRGHFERWGGSLATRPQLGERVQAFLRGLCYDGVAPWLPALCTCAALVLWGARGARWPRLKPFALALLPYALWAFAAQNVIEQPRHLLPLVEGALLYLACALAAQPVLSAALAAAVLAASAPLALERRRVPAAAAQAAAWVAGSGAAGTLVAAGRSARFFRALAGPAQVEEHAAFSDLAVSLARLPALPRRILATSELDLRFVPRRFRLAPGPRFCRDARIDRAQPCLSLSELVWSP